MSVADKGGIHLFCYRCRECCCVCCCLGPYCAIAHCLEKCNGRQEEESHTFDALEAPTNRRINREIDMERRRHEKIFRFVVIGNDPPDFASRVVCACADPPSEAAEGTIAALVCLAQRDGPGNVREFELTVRGIPFKFLTFGRTLLENRLRLLQTLSPSSCAALVYTASLAQLMVAAAHTNCHIAGTSIAPPPPPPALRFGETDDAPSSAAPTTSLATLPLDLLPRLAASLHFPDRLALRSTCRLLHRSMHTEGTLVANLRQLTRSIERAATSLVSDTCTSPSLLFVVLSGRARLVTELQSALFDVKRAATDGGGACALASALVGQLERRLRLGLRRPDGTRLPDVHVARWYGARSSRDETYRDLGVDLGARELHLTELVDESASEHRRVGLELISVTLVAHLATLRLT